jgi:hypothetical protein
MSILPYPFDPVLHVYQCTPASIPLILGYADPFDNRTRDGPLNKVASFTPNGRSEMIGFKSETIV